MEVQRFILRAYPAENHDKYYSWQAATVVIFVGENDKEEAQNIALRELKKRRWIPEKFLNRCTLTENRVRAEGGEVWKAYLAVQKGEIFWLVEFEDIPFSTKSNHPAISTPRLSEEFIDLVVEGAGGHRLTKEEAAGFREKNADYILGDFVMELKDLQKEGLIVATRQKKIAKIFSKYTSEGPVQKLDPFLLNEEDFEKYLGIVGTPIKKRILSASKQIKATVERLGPDKYKGAVILLNTGYSSMPHDFLEYLSNRYASKDTRSVNAVISISAWTMTNGFDSRVSFAFSPHKPDNIYLKKLNDTFWDYINNLMTEWVRNNSMQTNNTQEPMSPISFECENKIFTFGSPKIELYSPQSFGQNGSHKASN